MTSAAICHKQKLDMGQTWNFCRRLVSQGVQTGKRRNKFIKKIWTFDKLCKVTKNYQLSIKPNFLRFLFRVQIIGRYHTIQGYCVNTGLDKNAMKVLKFNKYETFPFFLQSKPKCDHSLLSCVFCTSCEPKIVLPVLQFKTKTILHSICTKYVN